MYIYENIRVTPLTHTTHTHSLGHQDVKSGRYKNKIKKLTPITIKV